MGYNVSMLTAKILATITQLKTNIDSNKQDTEIALSTLQPIVVGKSLSEQDFTSTLKTKLDNTPVMYLGSVDPTSLGPVPEGAIWYRTE